MGFLGCPGLLINLWCCCGITITGAVKSSLPPKPILKEMLVFLPLISPRVFHHCGKARWVEFLQNAYKTGLSGTKKDELVLKIMPFFHNEDVFIPFRILTPTEVQKFAGLTGFFSNVRVNLPLLTERVIRDYCGNSFHPALIRAALGSRDDFARWLSSLTPDSKHDTVATPAKTRAIYHRVNDEIRTKAVQEHRADFVQQSVGNDPMPDVTISQLPSLVKDQVPIISTQSTFSVPATRQMVQDLLKPKNVCGPFSAAP